MNASCLVGTRGAIMTADFLFKGIFAIGVGSMAIAFLRDFLKAANASDSTPTVVPGGVDAAHSLTANEELFFDEEGPYRASQRFDEMIQAHAEIEEQNLLLANHSTCMR